MPRYRYTHSGLTSIKEKHLRYHRGWGPERFSGDDRVYRKKIILLLLCVSSLHSIPYYHTHSTSDTRCVALFIHTPRNSLQHQLAVLQFISILTLIQEPTKSHLIITKDSTIAQKIPTALGPLCREPGAETNVYMFLLLHNMIPILFDNAFMHLSIHSFTHSLHKTL